MKTQRRNFILGLSLALLVMASVNAKANLIKDVKTRDVIATGVTYVDIDRFTDKGWIDIGVLKLDTKNPYSNLTGLISPAGVSKRSTLTNMMSADDKVVGAINGDFFTYGTYPMALGSLYADDDLVLTTPELAFARNNFFIRKDGTAGVGNINNNIRVVNNARKIAVNVNALNKVSAPFSAVSMLDHNWGKKSPGKALGSNVTEVLIRGNVVVDKRVGQEGFDLPIGSRVLTVVGPDLAGFNPGDSVTIDMGDYQNLKFSVGGGNILVKDGQVQKQGLSNKKDPRTAIGINRAGTEVLLVTVDGRNGKSMGMSELELAEFMRSVGAVQAINLDGGGSTTMAIKRPHEKSPSLANDPSGGSQRAIANGVGIKADAPVSQPHYVKIQADSTEIFPGFSYGVNLGVFDVYHNKLNIGQDQIQLFIDDQPMASPSYFSSSQPGPKKLRAQYGQAKGELDIIVREPISEIFLNTQRLDISPGQTHKFENIYGLNNQGYRKSIPFSMVDFGIIGDIGSIENGVFTASQNPAGGYIVASFSGVSKYIPVSVGFDTREVLNFHDGGNYSLATRPQDPSLVIGSIVDQGQGLDISYSVTSSKDPRTIRINLPSPVETGPADFLQLNLNADGKGAKARAIVLGQDGSERSIDFGGNLDKNDNMNLRASLGGSSYTLTALEFTVDKNVQFESNIRLNSLRALTRVQASEDLLGSSSKAQDPHNYIMESPGARISIGSVKAGDSDKMGHMSTSSLAVLYNGQGLTSVKAPVKINASKDSYQVQSSHNTKFISLKTNGQSIRSADPSQWAKFLKDLEASSEKNIVIIGHQDPSKLSGAKEKAFFDQTIQNAINAGKNIFIVCDGPDFKLENKDGYRRLELDMAGNSSKILDIYVSGDQMSYNVVDL